jgi:hypothetical protein
MLNIIGK